MSIVHLDTPIVEFQDERQDSHGQNVRPLLHIALKVDRGRLQRRLDICVKSTFLKSRAEAGLSPPPSSPPLDVV